METVERNKRSLDVFSDTEKKLHVLTKFLLNQELNLKDDIHSGEICYLKKVSQDGNKVLVSVRPTITLSVGQKITLYKILGRYLHLECTVEQDKGESQYILHLNKIAIAKKDRESSRIPVPPGSAWITNVVSSKAKIETDMFHVPTAVKVNFQDYETKLKNSVDFIKISTFNSREDGEIIRLIKKTKKGLLLEDVNNRECYETSPNEDFIVFADEIEEDINKEINNRRNLKIKSELILPILYLNDEEESIPIGYIHMQSKTENFDLLKAMEMKTLCFEMVDRIRHSNMIKSDGKFPVIDISEGGLKVIVDHPDLIQSLPKLTGFQFDIFFKMQSPLTAFGQIKTITKNEEGHLTVGLAIAGHSSRAGEKKRFLENVEFFRKQLQKN
ncbi:DUF1577 domain-containing protein [Leptospira levettii]|uniref:DUF1577 domain-containing protein n=1 Tax=Leptospira levettii TaxID=2023178 RepID=A0A2N0ARN4_9LEPT|nr:DUF1577 domain-containing protein [Leptospira levettii]PKA25880.1 hypothetical protein CH381_13415 [Leptospira sp. mixed culture ATI2-C-A1]MCG6148471.1 DUF1577 domain-containing protein [Leptospira levettii]MCW7464249.1 DUF1577 domain-containing protein [Leptospira levettii]MCW7472842.1 DUF1577 domain-containing protein [Leptospira levettii]MCW7495681.1 DUF1577 domain-containing protein [Leptospira levettii]